MKFNFTSVLLVVFVLFHLVCQSQNYKIQLGSAISTFNYTQANGMKADFLKPSSGSHFGICFTQAVLDTSKNLASTSNRSIFFNKNPKISKLLSFLNYDIGVDYIQLNAVGDLQKIPFTYQTDFVGIQFGYGLLIPLRYGFAISGQGQSSLFKMIHGNQLISNQYFTLANDPQFNELQFFTGYRGEIIKKVNDKMSVYIAYQKSQTFHSDKNGEATLNFAPTSFLIGLKF
jgi:hypothetical protein